MAKAGARVKITLRCSECKQRNYVTNKNTVSYTHLTLPTNSRV